MLRFRSPHEHRSSMVILQESWLGQPSGAKVVQIYHRWTSQPRALSASHTTHTFIRLLGNSHWATAGHQGIPSLEKLPCSCGLPPFPLKVPVSTSVFCYCHHFLIVCYCNRFPDPRQSMPQPACAPSPSFRRERDRPVAASALKLPRRHTLVEETGDEQEK